MTDAENEVYFSARYAEARAIFPLLSYPTFTHNASSTITTEELNVAGLAVFNLPPGFDVPAIDAANHTVKHEAGHAYLRRLERTTGIPRTIYVENFRMRFGYPTDYVVPNYSSGYVSLGEAWAEVFCNACEGRVVTSKSYLDELVDPLVARAWFQSQDPTFVSPPPPAPPPTTIDVRGQLPFVGNIYGTFSPKDSLTFHWNGPAVPEDADPLAILRADATFHINKGWGGISYHKAIWRDGTLYITRDMDAVLAACGNAVGNARSTHAQVMIGTGQSPTPQQWARMSELALAQPTVHPHGPFWSATECPGDEIRAWIAEGVEDLDRATFNQWFQEQYMATIDPTIRAMKDAYNPLVPLAHPKSHKHDSVVDQPPMVVTTGEPK